VPPELLEEIFELNMALEEDPADSAGRERFVEMRNDIDSEMRRKFAGWTPATIASRWWNSADC